LLHVTLKDVSQVPGGLPLRTYPVLHATVNSVVPQKSVSVGCQLFGLIIMAFAGA